MKIEVENNQIILKDVFSGILLKTDDGEEFAICMRDGGFEFNYGGKWYRAFEGAVSDTLLEPIPPMDLSDFPSKVGIEGILNTFEESGEVDFSKINFKVSNDSNTESGSV